MNYNGLPVGMCSGLAHLIPGTKIYDLMITECKQSYHIATIFVILEQ